MTIKKTIWKLILILLYFSAAIHFVDIVILAAKKHPIKEALSAFGRMLFFMVVAHVYLYKENTEVSAEYDASDEEDACFDEESGLPRKFSFIELESATDNFSDKKKKKKKDNFSSNKKLEGGGFGQVYEGNIDLGTKVAVKRLEPVSGGQGRKEFVAEVKTIGSISHVNLVRLIGYCVQNSNKLLVYEYMCNGSLDKWIFRPMERPSLDWQTRKKIIIHIAKGLAYLHDESRKKIIHLDVKPHNILLDGEFNAKISDFGLARFVDRDQSQVVTAMRGTRGYLAPEWFSNNKITQKVDVYSFGVVVLEVICGRKILENSYGEENEFLLHLVKRKAEEDQLYDVVDNRIANLEQHREEAVKMVKTAIWCLQADCSKRPSISMVVKTLEGLRDVETLSDYSFLTFAPMVPLTQANEHESAPLLPMTLSGPR